MIFGPAWRFRTLPDCTRVWTWYAHPGAPERVVTTLAACTRAAALAAPLWLGAPHETPQGHGYASPAVGIARLAAVPEVEGEAYGTGPVPLAAGGFGFLAGGGGFEVPLAGALTAVAGADTAVSLVVASREETPLFAQIGVMPEQGAYALPSPVEMLIPTSDTPVPEPGSLAVIAAAMVLTWLAGLARARR